MHLGTIVIVVIKFEKQPNTKFKTFVLSAWF